MMKSFVLAVLFVLVLIRGWYLETARTQETWSQEGWFTCEELGKTEADVELYGGKAQDQNGTIPQNERVKSLLKTPGSFTSGMDGRAIGTTVPRGNEFYHFNPVSTINIIVAAFKSYFGGNQEAEKEIDSCWK